MTRICLIGNSHVAALRQGWDIVSPEFPDVAADIFGAHTKVLRNTGSEGSETIVSAQKPVWRFSKDDESHQTSRIDVAAYDCFVVAGAGFEARCVVKTYNWLQFPALNGRKEQIVSRMVFKGIVQRLLEQTAAFHLVGLLTKLSTRPIFLVPAPMPADKGFADLQSETMAPWIAAAQSQNAELLLAVYDEAVNDLMSQGLHFVPQPLSTLAGPLSSQQGYSENSARLRFVMDELHPETDYFHMNGAYGAILWRDIIAQFRALPLPPVAGMR